ncbi:Transcriptional activator protein NhaR [Marinomonas aquimarina]|uniref:Transcriptional activator protein NhaR n=1 Tax=Marinomonas aquimarina TaxID=295068 RepID=A0A1A8TN40_9GAMM|nr:LysR family transcriptional regulator [Marinomonas aquimarina]SBS35208.1 Transcriptional activator protein NhaR [Marinomonas aquimarina]
MNPNHLKQLAIIIKQGSISAAAEQLFITQPTLTRSIQQLEQKVGAPLLKRTRYGVIATEIGERLGQLGEKILAEAEQGNEIIRQWHSGFHNQFSVGIDPLWEYATVDQTTQAFLDEPRFVFHLRTGSAATQIELLKREQLDFLLGPAHVTVAQRELSRDVLFRDRAAVFAGAKSPLIRLNRPIKKTELERCKWFIAGASAGFMNAPNDEILSNAAKISFTGGIHSVMHLLQHSDMLVRLPARLALMSGALKAEQMLAIEEDQSPRRDIALWSLQDDSERPDKQRVRALIQDFVSNMDQQVPCFGLDL